MSGILRRIAIAAGAGVAIGLASVAGRTLNSTRDDGRKPPSAADHMDAGEEAALSSLCPLLGALLDRIEAIEARLDAVENRGRAHALRSDTLEGALAGQSASIRMLSEGAQSAEANLRRLIDAVERLCNTAQPGEADPASFQDNLAQAMRNPHLDFVVRNKI
jgi:hypothetical protein